MYDGEIKPVVDIVEAHDSATVLLEDGGRVVIEHDPPNLVIVTSPRSWTFVRQP